MIQEKKAKSSPTVGLPTLWQMVDDLAEAGWKQHSRTIWKSPDGSFHLGPYGAWKAMVSQR